MVETPYIYALIWPGLGVSLNESESLVADHIGSSHARVADSPPPPPLPKNGASL